MRNESCKVLLLGEATVGKTSIAERFRDAEYQDRKDSTIGAAYAHITVPSADENPKNSVKLDLWDTAGQERFNSIIPFYFRDADVALLVYDLSKLETVKRLKGYVRNISEQTDNCHLIIVGNKMDLPYLDLKDIERRVRKEFKNLESFHDIEYYTISAKEEANVSELLQHVADLCRDKTPNRLIGKKEKESFEVEDGRTDSDTSSGWFSSLASYCNIM